MRYFVRLCKEYHTFFEGYQVPVGAIYGRSCVNSEEWFWVCQDYSNPKIYPIHYMKRTWACNGNKKVNKLVWHKINIGQTSPIYTQIKSILADLGYTPEIKSYRHPKSNRMTLEDKFTIGLKKSQGTYMFRTRPLGGDNADKGAPVRNQSSWWAIKKDMVRTSVNYGGNIYQGKDNGK